MKIAVLDDYQHAAVASADWSLLGPDAELVFLHEPLGEHAAEQLADAEVIVAMRERTAFPAALLQRLPRLRLLVTTGMRNASIDLAACDAQGVTVCGTASDPLLAAEQAWALVLALYKRIPGNDADTRRGHWQTSLGRSVRGDTLGVIGLGKLGAALARYGQAFGMRVLAWSPHLTPERCAVHGVTYATKADLLAQSDVVSLHLVLSASTRHILAADDFARMKPQAYLVNTSRGGLVDEAALCVALQSGQLGGAGLDVFAEEPLPASAPILRAPHTVLSPHMGYVSAQNYQTYYGQAIEDILAWQADTPIRVLRAT
ncbi:D-2-hydroxyacid dehydrogenase family protein [Achromobacter sp. GG226]|uniref:D-2-hydroxyacid dehydrogenase family protein n=1 Tax=Verticiella alkaliphila TaxID=2779529 RepID=UPI001C0C5B72|nr:D-2-hydroxyacid dehydrogenase family protein [Verticiella sp. GG226]MBU4611449.1 D-2-hydroxyacid dehydrogenase family protein [Verticiella sp. GG226]